MNIPDGVRRHKAIRESMKRLKLKASLDNYFDYNTDRNQIPLDNGVIDNADMSGGFYNDYFKPGDGVDFHKDKKEKQTTDWTGKEDLKYTAAKSSDYTGNDVENNTDWDDEVVDSIADIIHQWWSDWVLGVLANWHEKDGDYVIDMSKVKEWKKLVNTKYDELSDKEKEKDREFAYKILELLG